MPISGKLTRSVLGKLLRTATGLLQRCRVCCGPTPAVCTQAVFAKACYLELDANCDLENSLGFWVCADDHCFDDSTPFREAAATIIVEGRCYRTQADVVDIADLPEGTEVAIGGGSWVCRDTCDHEDCGTPPSVCGCACHVWYGESDPPGGNDYCCYGKYDADGNLVFNWSLSRTILQTSESEKFVTIILASCAERDCDVNASCTILEQTYNSEEASGTHYGCCLDKWVRGRTQVSRVAGCCDNPNISDGSVTSEGVETWCGPSVPRISSTVVNNFLVPGHGPGCQGGSINTTSENGTCGSYVKTIEEDVYASFSYDGDETCACQTIQHYEETLTITFSGQSTEADNAICQQCRQEYLEP